MEHFVGYHNSEKWGSAYKTGKASSTVRNDRFYTGKRFGEALLVGNHLWAIEGKGSPRSYWLVGSGDIASVSRSDRVTPSGKPGINVHFRVEPVFAPIELTGFSWFQNFLRQQQSFRFGLSRIIDRKVITRFEALHGKGIARHSGRVPEGVQALNRTDALRHVMRAIKDRQGQGAFRKAILAAYQRRCAISGCDVERALDAAHIDPFQGGRSDRVTNGLLLRTDLHTLFDFHLIAVDVTTWRIIVADAIRKSAYGKYHGKLMRRPHSKAHWPDAERLERHRHEARL